MEPAEVALSILVRVDNRVNELLASDRRREARLHLLIWALCVTAASALVLCAGWAAVHRGY